MKIIAPYKSPPNLGVASDRRSPLKPGKLSSPRHMHDRPPSTPPARRHVDVRCGPGFFMDFFGGLFTVGKRTIVCRPETNKIVKCIVGGLNTIIFLYQPSFPSSICRASHPGFNLAGFRDLPPTQYSLKYLPYAGNLLLPSRELDSISQPKGSQQRVINSKVIYLGYDGYDVSSKEGISIPSNPGIMQVHIPFVPWILWKLEVN